MNVLTEYSYSYMLCLNDSVGQAVLFPQEHSLTKEGLKMKCICNGSSNCLHDLTAPPSLPDLMYTHTFNKAWLLTRGNQRELGDILVGTTCRSLSSRSGSSLISLLCFI